MEFINKDCVTDTSNLSYFTPFSPAREVGEPLLQMTQSQIDTDSYFSASSPPLASPASLGLDEHYEKSRTHLKRDGSERDTLEAVVHSLPHNNLLECLRIHWETLKVEGSLRCPLVRCLLGIWKVARNKFVDYTIT